MVATFEHTYAVDMIESMPKGRPRLVLPAKDARALKRARRDVARARAEYAAQVADLVGRYDAGAVGRELGISRQSVHALLRRSIPEQDIPKIRQASKEGGTDDDSSETPPPFHS